MVEQSGTDRALIVMQREDIQVQPTVELRLNGPGRSCPAGLAGWTRVQGECLESLLVCNSPELEVLDLRDCPEGLQLHLALENLEALREVLLPERGRGVRIDMVLAEEFPQLVLRGEIAACRIYWPCQKAFQPLFGHYELPDTRGLALVDDREFEPVAGISMHVLADEQRGGLRYRDLRAIPDPEQVPWKLARPARTYECMTDFTDCLNCRIEGFRDLLCASSDKVNALRRTLSDPSSLADWVEIATGEHQSETRSRLLFFARNGDTPLVPWIMRCWLQHVLAKNSLPSSVLALLRDSDALWLGWSPLRRCWLLPDAGDVELVARTGNKVLTRRLLAGFDRYPAPMALQVLSKALGRCKELEDWVYELVLETLRRILCNYRYCLDTSLEILEKDLANQAPDANFDLSAEGFVDQFGEEKKPLFDTLLGMLMIGNSEINEQIVAIIRRHLSNRDKLQIATSMTSAGIMEGRKIISEVFSKGYGLSGEMREAALASLLSPP